MRSSSTMTISASSTSWCWSASIVRSSVLTTMSRPCSARSSSSRSSSLNATRVSISAELPGDVFLGPAVVRLREHLVRGPALDQFAVEHERRGVRNARGLLHVVGHDHDRVALLELVDQLLD